MKFHEQTTDELENFFEIYFPSCLQRIEGGLDMPFFQVRHDADVIDRFIEFYTKILEESKIQTRKI